MPDSDEMQIDLPAGQRLALGRIVELAQHALGRAHGMLGAGYAEHVAAVGDLDAEAQLDLAQVLVERAVEIGQAFAVGGFEREIAMVGSIVHRKRCMTWMSVGPSVAWRNARGTVPTIAKPWRCQSFTAVVFEATT